MGTTPIAPCTPNCTQNTPAQSFGKVEGSIQRGMKDAPSRRNNIIAIRRPVTWDKDPATTAPLSKKEVRSEGYWRLKCNPHNGPATAHHSGDRGLAQGETFGILKVGWVQILLAMQSRIYIYVDRDQLSRVTCEIHALARTPTQMRQDFQLALSTRPASRRSDFDP